MEIGPSDRPGDGGIGLPWAELSGELYPVDVRSAREAPEEALSEAPEQAPQEAPIQAPDGLLAGGTEGPPEAEPVSPEELNAWRRGFTPQAEIWNGRLAMLGLSVGLTVVVLARLFAH